MQVGGCCEVARDRHGRWGGAVEVAVTARINFVLSIAIGDSKNFPIHPQRW